MQYTLKNFLMDDDFDFSQIELDSETSIDQIMDLPLDWENAFENDEASDSIHVSSAADGLVISLSNLGCVDIEYISKISGLDMKEVINRLKGSIYQDPLKWDEKFWCGWMTSDEYLSGNLAIKLKAAEEANIEYNGYFQDNVDALKKLMPEGVDFNNIYFNLASPWIPTRLVVAFIASCYGFNFMAVDDFLKRDEYTGQWYVDKNKGRVYSTLFESHFGTSKMSAINILERVLNMRTITVNDRVCNGTDKNGKPKYKSVINKAETMLANEKARMLDEEFKTFVKTSPNNMREIEDKYNECYGSTISRRFDGSFLTFPNMNPNVTLFDYQKNAIARIIFTKNTLLAHDVGSGKTYIMIASGEEMIRMGLSKKNLYVVPNSIVSQWEKDYRYLYPNAKIKVIHPNQFNPSKRRACLKDIIDGDYSAIIMPYSSFEMINMSNDLIIEDIKAEISVLEDKYLNEKKPKPIEELLKKLNKTLEELLKIQSSNDINFEDLGITRLYIDEAHNFKNVPISTKISKVMGINAEGSKHCKAMQEKVHYINSQENSGVIMATGTPITNSITDAYVFQSYLQPGALESLDIKSFDNWVAMFAEKHEEFEVDVDTSGFRLATRFSRFHNLPELTTLFSDIADFHEMDESKELPKCDGRIDTIIKRSSELEALINSLSNRTDLIRAGAIKKNEDNMLKITNDGRKAALDMRLVDRLTTEPFTATKAFYCAENVSRIYKEHPNTSQLIFCDLSTPKDDFNIYDELKLRLITLGVRSTEIAYVHEASTDKQRALLFDDVKKGKIRVLIGSTSKLGTGVNVQDNLIAIHHLDVPWRPADMVQREGRLIRQGNTNPEVYIFRYITEGSFDSYSWQLLETKQHFINELLSNTMTSRSKDDVSDTVLDYASVKAIAIGNPVIKERFELANELTKLKLISKKTRDMKSYYQKQIIELPKKIEELQNINAYIKEDIKRCERHKTVLENEDRKNIAKTIYEALSNYLMMPEEKLIYVYNGFDIVMPKKMSSDHFFVWVKGDYTYKVNIGTSDIGALLRIDNLLNGLPGMVEANEASIREHEISIKNYESEIIKDYDYDERIQALTKRLDAIDKSLNGDE